MEEVLPKPQINSIQEDTMARQKSLVSRSKSYIFGQSFGDYVTENIKDSCERHATDMLVQAAFQLGEALINGLIDARIEKKLNAKP
jgi:hypothetical protein